MMIFVGRALSKYMKKYVIHILAVPALGPDSVDLPLEKCAAIICTIRTNPYIDNEFKENKLLLDFLDVEDETMDRAFNRIHAGMIINFINNLPDEVSDLYVCCSKGGSRSPACAAALLRMSGRSDMDVWQNPFYTPNTLVYKTLCREYGIYVSDEMVKTYCEINDLAYKMAQKNGNAGEYERWQILF